MVRLQALPRTAPATTAANANGYGMPPVVLRQRPPPGRFPKPIGHIQVEERDQRRYGQRHAASACRRRQNLPGGAPLERSVENARKMLGIRSSRVLSLIHISEP